jgi:prevent-host-death family protein
VGALEASLDAAVEAIGIRELKKRSSEILRRVREEGKSFEITYHGRVIARIVPVTETGSTRSAPEFWERWDRLAEAIGERWPTGVSAVDAIREGRREL